MAIAMKSIIKLLNDISASHPEKIALTEEGHDISFAELQHLISNLGQELFDEDADIYGQCIENKTSCRIFALCAERRGVFSKLVNIPATVNKPNLSFMLKTARIEVIYTDLMDKLFETTHKYGPFISLVTPVEFYHRKLWKVRFFSDHRGLQKDFGKIKLRHRKHLHLYEAFAGG